MPIEAESSIERRESGLSRSLSAKQLAMIAIGGAIGTGLFLGSGFAIQLAGPSVIVSYAIGALISLLLMGCLAEMAVTHPTTGSFGAWAELYVSPLAGFLVRYSYWSCVVLAVGTEVTAVAIYMRYWFPAVPAWIWIAGFSGVLLWINARNVKLFGTVEYTFSAIKLAAIGIFILMGSVAVWHGGFGNYTSNGGFFPHGAWGTWTGVIVSIFSYLSIEMIAVAAGEAEDPRTAIVRAFRSTVARLVIFYLPTLAIMVAIVPWTEAGKGESPFVTVVSRSGVPYAAGAVNFVILIAALSAMNSQLYITARMMFSLSRAGHAPARFGRLNANGSPAAAMLLSSAGIGIAAALNAAFPQSAFTLMISVSMFGAMFTWLMIFVTHLFFRRVEQPVYRMPGFPYTSILGAMLMAAILISTAFTSEFRWTLAFGLPSLGLFALAYTTRPKH